MNKNKIFCIAHAAGSAMNYYQWKRYLNDTIEIVPLELAGRGAKFKEPAYKNMEEIINGLYREIESHISEAPYFIYGHSFGSWIAYELYYKILRENQKKPNAMFFSGMQSPIAAKNAYTVEDLTDENLIKLFDHFGGTDLNTLNQDSLREHYLGLMRADYTVIRDYAPIEREILIESDCFILSGSDDKTIENQGLLAWKNLCLARFQINKISGEHFFPFTNLVDTCEFVNTICAEYISTI